ncbi:Tetratricopeptide-like helical domain-containing protein [Dioscorea alata]|uniref:Tetratricopeptide-like helical domain-containing protein n=1 Tax=Dioscorea alata TaxID=55571 RepID=A0ACB7U131_DIOAL|nr:Tetratricopeptide-like helical domain-containing protein [Dioscorea alata]
MRRSKWPFLPYKGKWQGSFSERQAMETLRSKVLEEQHHSETNFVSMLVDCFRIYGSNPSFSGYSFMVQHLLHKNFHSYLPPILDHLEKSERIDVPEKFFVNLIHEYGKADMLQEAVNMFLRIPKFRCSPSALSLNSVLNILCRKNDGLALIHDVLLKAPALNIRLEASSFRILIRALCRTGRVGFAIELFNIMQQLHEFIPDSGFYLLILRALCKYSTPDEVMKFLEDMWNGGVLPSTWEYNAVINLLVSKGRLNDAYSILTRMKVEGKRPDIISYTTILNGFILVNNFIEAEEVFDEMLVLGIDLDVVTYNTYISGLCKQREFGRAYRMVLCMEKAGCKPDTESFNTLMDGYTKAGEHVKVKEVMSKMLEKGYQGNSRTNAILIDGLLMEQKPAEACQMLMEMVSKGLIPNSATFNAVVCSLCQKNFLDKGIQVLEEMISHSIAPDDSLWEALLSAINLRREEMAVHLEEMILGGSRDRW